MVRRIALVLLAVALLLSSDRMVAIATEGHVVLSGRYYREWADRLRRLPPGTADADWIRLIRSLAAGDYRLDPKESARAYSDAVAQLTPRGIVELASDGPNLVLSEAYVRARLKRAETAEAAAECRAAIARHGVASGQRLVELAKSSGAPVATAGGIESSIAHIEIVCAGGPEDAGAPERTAVGVGLRATMGEAAGFVRVGFRTVEAGPDGSVSSLEAARVARDAVASGAGVVVLAGPDPALAAALVAATTRAGIVLLTSGALEFVDRPRPPEQAEPRPVAYRLEPDFHVLAKRLMDAARAAGVRRIAIAVPSGGPGASAMATTLLESEGLASMPPLRLDYESGRRNYQEEAQRFATSGADAIYLAGPGGESGDWAIALAALRRKPPIFGDAELDPAGYHDRARLALEGATYVGSDWEPVDTSSAYRSAARSERGAALIDLELAGRAVGSALAGGALSAGDLFRRFGDCGNRVCPIPPPSGIVSIPLFRIQGGAAVPIH